ncbi:MAG: hypothetical protein WCK65_08930 [Rhodospirillaceae bacterium]
MTTEDGLSLVVFSGGYDRVHYALAIAAAAAATGRRVNLLVAGGGLRALLAEDGDGRPGWHRLDPSDDGTSPADRDHNLGKRGIATMEELLGACAALGVHVTACEMGLRAFDLPINSRLRDDIKAKIGGIVGFLALTSKGTIMFV